VPAAAEPPTAVPETQIQTAAVAAAAPVTALIDPAIGGVLTTADQVLSVQIPPDAASDLLSLSLLAVDPSGAANIAINGQLYALSIVDSVGNPITTFLQPVTLLTDSSAVSIATLDPSTGAVQSLPLDMTDDGRIQVSLMSLGVPAVLPEMPGPADQPPDAEPPSDGT
jgi:hypothetical protein